jgi:fumarate reductase subunit D
MGRTNEPFWWSLFSAGAMVAAFLFPVTIFITGIAVAAGWISEEGLFSLIHHPLTRLYLFLLISLPLFEAAHRTRFVLNDMGLKAYNNVLAWLLYGFALVVTILAIVFLVQM